MTEQFVVSFNSDGGSTVPAQSITKGEKAVEPAEPTKPGFIFAGWYNGTTKYNFNDPVNATLTLTAHWTPNTPVVEGYTATLKYDNGSADGSLKATKTGNSWFFTKPADPSKTGHTFAGWFTEAGAAFDFAKAVTADVVLVAHWTPNTSVVEGYTATLKYDNGSADGSLEATKTGDSWFFTKPADPSKTGHTFAGWFTEAGAAFDFAKAVTADVVLVAHWTPNTSVVEGYTATLKYDNGSADGSLEATKTGDSWFFTKPADPSKTGHTFAGWFTEAGAAFDFAKAVTANVVLVAHWTPVVVEGCTATLHYNNGTADATLEAVKDGNDWYFDEPAKPTKDYMVFDCWCTDEALKEPFNFDTPVTANMSLYARYVQLYDTVDTVWDFVSSASAITSNPSGNVVLTQDMNFQGKFLLGTGARFEISGNNCINTQNKTLEFVLNGSETYNAVTFNAKWASSAKGSFQIKNLATGEVVYDSGELLGNSAAFDVSVPNLPAGRYAVVATGSVRFYAFSLTEKLPQGPVTGIELNTSNVEKNVLLGRPFSTTGLSVVLAYDNGRKDVIDLANATITAPEDFTTAAGAKTITIKYDNKGTEYTQTYTVNVCEIS